jgi:molecular chaperone DnaK
MKEYGDKIPADKKGTIESALNKLKEAHKTQDVAQIDPAVTELNNAWTAASEELYKATQGAGQPGDGAGQQQQGAGNAGENVQDAEYEEVK